MQLNDQTFTTYVSDTVQTIEERIAFELKTLPEWLMFQSPRPTSVDQYIKSNLNVIDYLRFVLNQTHLDLPKHPYPRDVTEKQVHDLFIATNVILESSSDRQRQLLFHTIKGSYRDVELIWMDRTSIIGQFKKALRNNENLVTNTIEKFIEFDNIVPYQFNNYSLDYIQFTLNLGNFNEDLLSLFNSIVSSRYVPYAVVTSNSKTLYKIHVGFKVNPEWLEFEADEVILLKVNCEIDGLRPLQDKYGAYSNVAFAVHDNQLYVTMDVNIGHRNVDKTKFIDRVLSAFSNKLIPQSEKDNKIVSVYVIPHQCIDQYIFADIAMNNELVSLIISINEFIKPSKISSTIYCHIAGGTNTASLVLKQTKKPNEHGMDDSGEWYVKVRLKVNDTSDIIVIQNIIGRIFSIYNANYDDTVDEYRKYIPTWSPQSCLVAPKKKLAGAKGLRAIAPEVFYPTYSRKCANQPEVINSASDANGSQTMTFPIHGEVVNDIPVKPRIYTCLETSHPYIGLRRNELGNKNIFESLPCCFKRDQVNKQGSLYRKYFFGEKQTTTARQLQDTEAYKRRILLPGETETLPANITKLFSILESDPTVTYVRNGITRSKLSSIEAILYGRGQVAYKKMRLTTIINKVHAHWKKMYSEEYAMAARQELYEMDINDIREEIKTLDLRPSKFVHALETCMDCNIFIFTSSNDNIDGSLLVPNHLVFYSKFNPNRETFFLYELYDPAEEYPAVELITKFNGSTSFFPGDEIVKKIFHVFNRQTKTSIPHITIPKFPRLNVIGQVVDHNGKCRVVNININNVVLTMITDPLPPFAAVQLTKIYRISSHSLPRLGKVKWQRNGEVGLVLGNINCVVLTTLDEKPLENVPFNTEPNKYINLDSSSILEKFDTTKRTANVLLQYTLKYLSEYKSLDLLSFAKDVIEIRPDVNYSIISSNFASNPTFHSNGKVFVSSIEALKRLLYVVRISLLNDPNILNTYRGKTHINNFYSTLNVFSKHYSTIFLEGTEAVRNLIKLDDYNINKLYSQIQINNNHYYFKNNVLSDDIYLIIAVDNLNIANDTVDSWTRLGYLTTPESSNSRPAIYNYINQEEINLVSGSDKMYDGIVIAYRQDATVAYVAALNI